MAALPLRELVNAYRISQAIHVAAVLRIADLLADGPRTSDELAEQAGAHPPTLYRLLRALATVGVFEEQDGRRFALTPFGEPLRHELGDWARFVGAPPFWATWGELEHSVRTGENAFKHLHGTDVWSYRAQRPHENELFDRAMTANTRLVARAVVEAYDFSRFEVVADIAGGHGALLSAILDANPSVRGILFDQEHVVAGAHAGDRVTVVAGSFFDSVPRGADAYVLKDIIHDWDDAEAVRILRVVREAMEPHAVLLLVERDLDQVDSKWIDLQMLVLPGGRERTFDEYETLFSEAGLRLTGVTSTSTVYAVVQAENARSK